MAVSCFKKSVNSCTWLETAANLKEMAEHCWKWLKLNENGRKWLEYKENCWKWLVSTIYIFVWTNYTIQYWDNNYTNYDVQIKLRTEYYVSAFCAICRICFVQVRLMTAEQNTSILDTLRLLLRWPYDIFFCHSTIQFSFFSYNCLLCKLMP